MDKILEHISTDYRDGRKTLLACALVATWWAGPSQRRLFSSVLVGPYNYQRWMDGVVLPRPKVHLLEHIRSLGHSRSTDTKLKYRMRDLPRDSGQYLSALHNLRSLSLHNTKIERIREVGFRACFSAFRETLTYLALESLATSFNAFVMLVDYFPNITTLQFHVFDLEPDEGPVPTLSRPLRGKVQIRAELGCLEFLDRFAKLDLEYEKLVIFPSFICLEERLMKSAFQISASTVKFLRLAAVPRGE